MSTRTYIVFGLLVAMLVGLGVLLVMTPSTPHDVPGRRPPTPASSAQNDAGVTAPSRVDAATPPARPDAGPPTRDGGVAPPLMPRPLRVVALGWDLLAPAVLANGGAATAARSDVAAAGLDVRLASAPRMADVEAALARGGAEDNGADIAIVPLPALVASSERLRALAPVVFFVTGWSRGREAVLVDRGTTLARLAAGRGEVALETTAGTTEAFVGLSVLELAGIAPSRVRLVGSTDLGGGGAPTVATPWADRERHGAGGARNVLLTTADATRLVPFVAVAPASLVADRPGALRAFASAWLEGQRKLEADVPAAARRVAGVAGGADAIGFVELLGQTEPATLRESARLFGLAGRGAVTLDRLYARTHATWRAAGVLASPPPEVAPISGVTVAALVRAELDASGSAPVAPANGPLGAAMPAGARALLVVPLGSRRDEPSDAAQIAFVAGVFERALLRVSSRTDTVRLLSDVRDRYDITARRLVAGRAPTPQIELFAPP